MEKLTLEYAMENKFTFKDCVKYFKPDADDEYCDFILWEKTCYPFSTEGIISNLNELFLNEDNFKRNASEADEV